MGIMIHSFVIGLTLSVTNGSDFTSLTTAIIFHQLFEGLSLGIRIAALPPAHPKTANRWGLSSLRWLAPTLSVLFGITTPAGMALGMAVWQDRRGNAGDMVRERAWMLLIQGIMSAVSAGMLIYAATIEMIAGDFVYGDVDGHHHHHHQHAEESDDELPAEPEMGAQEGGGGHVGSSRARVEDGGDAGGARTPEKSSVVKRILALFSLFAGAAMMVLIALGE
ncbi:Zinc/iron permease [Gymnopilus junonius]|uniref:Zinc/iron permease n=1 Tax=Gymnopilus junonius TaxID=109634 RepID=A0A9P5TH02_GYMJU|nr:Zinc/iron permease [Gymnopilus junonius]